MSNSFKDLYERVIKGGLFRKSMCSVCGACVAVCPKNLLSFREHVFFYEEGLEFRVEKTLLKEIISECIDCGLCYDACPQINFDLLETEKIIYGEFSSKTNIIGYFRKILSAKAVDQFIAENGQSGGVVTAIIKYLLENNVVDGAIVTLEEPSLPGKPIPYIITKDNITELLKSQKSKYFSSAALVALRHAIENIGLNSLAIVLLPCQVHALVKMRLLGKYKNIINHVKVTIGLFCFGTYWYKPFSDWLKRKYNIDLSEVNRMRMTGRAFIIEMNDGRTISGKKDETLKLIKESCKHCKDFANVLADISVGEIGSPEGWSTVIARTKIGEEIVNEAEIKGYIRTKDITDEGLMAIYELGLIKFKYYVSKRALVMSKKDVEGLIRKLEIPKPTLLGIIAIYIFTNSGILVYSKTLSKELENIDASIVASITSAINDYVKTFFKARTITTIDMEKLKILIEHGEKLSLIALVRADSQLNMNREPLRKLLAKLEELNILEQVESLSDIKEIEKQVEEIVLKILL